ncbi:MAG: hypothetical protein GX087_07810, partial [Desulfobulbaceae bacterium]|nr:hypothetical protein [Desulfobulbaceae bacterium]
MQRFAIYFTPAPESDLAQAAATWLGRDIFNQGIYHLPEVHGLAKERVQALLQSPRHYGFHATLKPPFRLKPGCNAVMLEKRMETFAASESAFILP